MRLPGILADAIVLLAVLPSAGARNQATLTFSFQGYANNVKVAAPLVCPTFVQGWTNEDGGVRTSPTRGGPPNGGQWAVVRINT